MWLYTSSSPPGVLARFLYLPPSRMSPFRKMCNPFPDVDSSRYVGGMSDKTSLAMPFNVPSSLTQSSKSMHVIPSSANKPYDSPALDTTLPNASAVSKSVIVLVSVHFAHLQACLSPFAPAVAFIMSLSFFNLPSSNRSLTQYVAQRDCFFNSSGTFLAISALRCAFVLVLFGEAKNCADFFSLCFSLEPKVSLPNAKLFKTKLFANLASAIARTKYLLSSAIFLLHAFMYAV